MDETGSRERLRKGGGLTAGQRQTETKRKEGSRKNGGEAVR